MSTSRLDAVPVKLPSGFFAKINRLVLKFTWKFREPKIGKIILKEKNMVGGFTLPNFKTYNKAVLIKRV